MLSMVITNMELVGNVKYVYTKAGKNPGYVESAYQGVLLHFVKQLRGND